MKRVFAVALIAALVLSLSGQCFADFQYTETSKITGGAAAGAMKFAGVFSKGAREATHGTNSTISLKGNKMRREEDALGTAEIIDLDGRRIIQIDTKKKTYSVMTFDEMRARLEEAKRKAAEQQAKHSKDKQAQVKIVPKVKVSAGTGTKKILDYNAHEMKVRVDMLIQSDDPDAKNQTPQSANTWVNSDSWVAPVKGYDEMKRFYLKLAKELNWVPGAVMDANPRISPAMVEYRKSAASLEGMPLLSMISVGMEGQPGAAQQQSSSSTSGDDQKQSSNPLTHGIGGLFGKKKKSDSDQSEASSSTPGSLLDTTIEVTSVSTKPVDAALFAMPDGYKQVSAK